MLYVGVLIFLFLIYLRPQEWVPMIYGWRIVFAVMLALLPPWLLTLHSKKLFRTPEDLFMGLYWCVCVFSIFKASPSGVPDVAWGFGKVVLCYLFVAHVIDSRGKLGVALFVMCLLLLGIAMKAGWNVGTQGQYASVGMFANRNDFAHGIAATLPLAVAFLLRGGLLLKISGAGLMATIIPQIIKSGSRGGQLAAMFAVYTVLIVRVKTRRARYAMLVLGALGAFGAFAASGRLGTVLHYQQDESAMARITIWSHSLSAVHATPFNFVIGRGYGLITAGMWRSRSAHSSYMNNLYELGVPGVFVLVGLLFFAFRDAYSVAKNAIHPTTRMFALGLTGLMAGTIVGSAVESLSYRIYVLVPVAMISAMRIIEQRERAATTPAEHSGTERGGEYFLYPPVTAGSGLAEHRLVTKKELGIVAALTFGCWFAYEVLVAVS